MGSATARGRRAAGTRTGCDRGGGGGGGGPAVACLGRHAATGGPSGEVAARGSPGVAGWAAAAGERRGRRGPLRARGRHDAQ